MKTILVTGGAGFIGSNYIHFLLEEYTDVKIINLDKLTYCGNLENLKDIEKDERYEFVKGDICDKKIVEKVMQKSDEVVHFAAESHVDRSIVEAGSFLQTDVIGTFVMLEAAKKFGVKKFVQISTDEVYGSIEKGSFKETTELKPRNPYSASKAAADRLAYSFYATHGVPVVITRGSNNFGPNQFPEKVIPLFITNLIQGKKVPLYGDGLNVRDWLFVTDHCKAIDLARTRGKNGEVYNVGGGTEITNLHLTETILKEFGKGKEMIEFVKDRPGHDRRYSIDSSKMIELGWKQEKRFEEKLHSTIEWYKSNEKWWKPLLKKAEFDRFKK